MSIQDENMGYDRVNWVPYYLYFMLDKTLDLMHAKFFTHTHTHTQVFSWINFFPYICVSLMKMRK